MQNAPRISFGFMCVSTHFSISALFAKEKNDFMPKVIVCLREFYWNLEIDRTASTSTEWNFMLVRSNIHYFTFSSFRVYDVNKFFICFPFIWFHSLEHKWFFSYSSHRNVLVRSYFFLVCSAVSSDRTIWISSDGNRKSIDLNAFSIDFSFMLLRVVCFCGFR